jgi:hypothetical protein
MSSRTLAGQVVPNLTFGAHGSSLAVRRCWEATGRLPAPARMPGSRKPAVPPHDIPELGWRLDAAAGSRRTVLPFSFSMGVGERPGARCVGGKGSRKAGRGGGWWWPGIATGNGFLNIAASGRIYATTRNVSNGRDTAKWPGRSPGSVSYSTQPPPPPENT